MQALAQQALIAASIAIACLAISAVVVRFKRTIIRM